MPTKIVALIFVCFCFSPLQASGGDDLAKLGKARRDAAAKAYKVFFDARQRAELQFQLYDASVRWLHAELDLATKKEERTAGYAAHLQRMKDWIKSAGGLPKGQEREGGYIILEAFQIEAEYWLAKEQAGK